MWTGRRCGVDDVDDVDADVDLVHVVGLDVDVEDALDKDVIDVDVEDRFDRDVDVNMSIRYM